MQKPVTRNPTRYYITVSLCDLFALPDVKAARVRIVKTERTQSPISNSKVSMTCVNITLLATVVSLQVQKRPPKSCTPMIAKMRKKSPTTMVTFAIEANESVTDRNTSIMPGLLVKVLQSDSTKIAAMQHKTFLVSHSVGVGLSMFFKSKQGQPMLR